MENEVYKFSFEDFHIISVNFELKNDKKYKISKDIEVSTNLAMSHDYQKGKKNIQLFMKIDVCGEKLPFSLSVEGVGLFGFAKKFSDASKMDKLLKINCAAIIFPYIREIAADLVRRSGLPQFNLPPVNFVTLYHLESKVKEVEK